MRQEKDGLVKTLIFVKQAIISFRDFSFQNKVDSSVFLIDKSEVVPEAVILNRELAGALLTQILSLAFATSKNRGISVFVSYKSKEAVGRFPDKRDRPLEPAFELSLNGGKIKLRELSKLNDSDDSPNRGANRRRTGCWGFDKHHFS